MRVSLTATLVALAAIVPAPPALAQDFMLGGRLGIAFANFGGDIQDLDETDSKAGASLGAVFGLNFGRWLGIQPELLYVIKGTEDEELGTDFWITVKYLELQAPIVLRIPTGGPVVPRFYSGPAVAVQLACQSSASDGVATLTFDCDQVFPTEVGDIVVFTETKAIDFGWIFGGGIDLAAGPGALTFDLRYNLGLTDINDFPGLDTTIKNRTLQLLTGYVFYFGG